MQRAVAEDARDSDGFEPYIDVPTVCARLGINRKWLYRVIRDEAFPAYRMPGGMLRFRQSEIDVWLREHRATPGEHARGRPRKIPKVPDE